MQQDAGLDALDAGFPQGTAHALLGLLPAVVVGNDFANHRIIIGGYPITGINMAVHPDTAAGGCQAVICPGEGVKRSGSSRIDAALDGMSLQMNVFLTERERLPAATVSGL